MVVPSDRFQYGQHPAFHDPPTMKSHPLKVFLTPHIANHCIRGCILSSHSHPTTMMPFGVLIPTGQTRNLTKTLVQESAMSAASQTVFSPEHGHPHSESMFQTHGLQPSPSHISLEQASLTVMGLMSQSRHAYSSFLCKVLGEKRLSRRQVANRRKW